jgi:CRP-like cAMP-binding protein
MTEQELQYGEQLRTETGTVLYRPGDPVSGSSIYFVVAGLVRLDLSLPERLSIYLHPDSVFGLVETLLACPRLTGACCLESSILYRWDREGFDLASSVSWELAYNTITGLTQYLRVLNGEFTSRLAGAQAGGGRGGRAAGAPRAGS